MGASRTCRNQGKPSDWEGETLVSTVARIPQALGRVAHRAGIANKASRLGIPLGTVHKLE
jgi:hypothetical protein